MDKHIFIESLQEIIQQGEVTESQLYSDLLQIASFKYGSELSKNERKIIEAAKEKIITRLYVLENHQLDTSRYDPTKEFKLDALESQFLIKAEEELSLESAIEINGPKLKLMEAGILKYKEVFGEI